MQPIILSTKLMEFIMTALPKVQDIRPNLGCDPEFFFRSNGEVIGAEKLLPKDGLKIKGSSGMSKIIIDGVQAELNPVPNTCRAILASQIRFSLVELQKKLAKDGKQLTADFSRTVIISKENLMDLNEESRKFGCAPSTNIYAGDAGVKISAVDATEYLTRAAGGHIHIGHMDAPSLKKTLTTHHEKVVALMDILCGNTCVLVDRDEGNIERRKLYGRAGEFRLPKHGLEYRTLSNFWLTSYPLMSLAFGMARLAVQLVNDPTNSKLFYETFTNAVKAKNIADAINNNDFDLAMENFERVEKLITDVAIQSENFPINSTTIDKFHHFVKMVNKKGMSYWFPENPLDHWFKVFNNDLPNITKNSYGFVQFCNDNVKADMEKKAAKKKVAA